MLILLNFHFYSLLFQYQTGVNKVINNYHLVGLITDVEKHNMLFDQNNNDKYPVTQNNLLDEVSAKRKKIVQDRLDEKFQKKSEVEKLRQLSTSRSNMNVVKKGENNNVRKTKNKKAKLKD